MLPSSIRPSPPVFNSLALGAGDPDCVYHSALDEMGEVCASLRGCEDQAEMLPP